jgi:tRNA U34 5-methylaminomethyl-2-thiouridine-forming methyltransferase MnmC
MSNDEQGAVLEAGAHGGLNARISFDINGSRGFVHNNNLCSLQKSPSQTQELPLTSREVGPRLHHGFHQFVWI